MTPQRRRLGARRCFVDTSAYFAFANKNEDKHSEALILAREMASRRLIPYTTNAIIFETHALILSRIGRVAARHFLLDSSASNTVVIRVRKTDEDRARDIIFQYTDKDFSFTDALSFAVMERLGMRIAFTFDSDFSQYGFEALSSP